jgi:glutamate transport system substrate-binding protein
MRFSRIAAVALSAALAMSVAACGDDDEPAAAGKFPAGSTMEKLNKAGKLKVGTKFTQPLFGQKGLDGKLTGFDVEIAKLIATELGIAEDKIEWVEANSKVREEFIEKGTADVVVATYTINDARKEKVSFAGPYYVAGQALLVRTDDAGAVTAPTDLSGGDKKVCSVTGSTPAKTIETYLKDKAAQLVLFDSYDKCVDALKTKTVDAVTTDDVILLGFAAKDTSLKLLPQTFTAEPYGIGVKKDDKVFRDFINDLLEKASADGRYKKAWELGVGSVKPAPSLPKINRY